MTSDLHPFGPHFRLWRERRGYSLKEAAGDIITPQFLSQFERGQKSLTIDKLSRLLISIGVDWVDFLVDYPGERVSYAYNLLPSRPKSSHVTFLKEALTGYYQDNPTLKEMFLDSQRGQDYVQELNAVIPLPEHTQNLIHKMLDQRFTNLIENDLFAIYRYNFPLDYVFKMIDLKFELLDISLETRQLDAVHDNVLYLASAITLLINKEAFEDCQQLIDRLRDKLKEFTYSFYCDFFVVQIFLEGHQVKLWLNQNKEEALPKAREILELYDHMYDFTKDPYLLERRTDFLRSVNMLNKTGKTLYDD